MLSAERRRDQKVEGGGGGGGGLSSDKPQVGEGVCVCVLRWSVRGFGRGRLEISIS